MNDVNPTIRPAASDEPIPGYRLIELIGHGGYGDVWKVSAPGGVSKAIKLIFDDQPSRSTMELRALNRIKDVRHPFLLSIDRIEQRPGMLTIVTELADRNLQQHCALYRDKGRPGIPQDELLAMLRDVADVLDFIYQEYALQHLDIKAANLLVFGKRLKVGDFGLVKNIYERSANLVDGMTPAYAAPEIFTGKPSCASDQYSLAIVYQEMLTGMLPFSETSASGLAMQHLHEVPNLRSLPAAQQPVIARALSKDPQQRFPSCTALLEELTAAAQRGTVPENFSAVESLLAKEVLAKAGYRPSPDPGSAMDHKPLNMPAPGPKATSRPPRGTESVEVAPGQPEEHLSPTIVIGIGGSATQLFRQLKQRLGDRLGSPEEVPAVKLLLIDSDAESINAINFERQFCDGLQTVSTPLLTAADYRAQGPKHRRWLSRRWLYNIPRNLSTDGLRPLGRLALVSHGPQVKSAIRAAIKQITAAEASCIGGRRVAGPPRILLVASISGGTGSGMLLDLAYAARAELQLAGFHQGAVDALMLHSTPVGADRHKAMLNSIAALRELSHYGTPGKFYPGEPLLEVPPFHGNNRTFSHTQLMSLGDNLDHTAWRRALDDAAEYVFARLTTPRSQFLTPGSDPSMESADGPAALKLDVVQVRQIGSHSGRYISKLARQLCVEIINGWSGTPVASGAGNTSTQNAARMIQTILQKDDHRRHQELVDSAAIRVQEIGVDLEQLIACAREKLVQELATEQRDYLQSMLQQALESRGKTELSDAAIATLVLTLQDRAIGLDFGERPSDPSRNTLFDLLHSRLASQAMQLSSKFSTWVHSLVDHPDAGVDAARCVAEAGRNYIHDLGGGSGKELREIHQRQIESRILLTSPSSSGDSQKLNRWWSLRTAPQADQANDALVEHGLLCFQELILACVQLQLQSIEAQASAVIDKLMYFGHELKQFSGRFAPTPEEAEECDQAHLLDYEQSLWQLLLTQRHRLVKELRRRIDQNVFKGPKKLQRFLAQTGSLNQDLWEPLQYHSRQVVLNSMRQVLLILLQHGKTTGEAARLDLDAVLEAQLQEPLMLGHTDGEHVLVVLPSDASTNQVERRMQAVGHAVHAISAPSNNIAICRQASGNSVYALVQQIAMHQAALIQLADNLCSRQDIVWEPLSETQPRDDGPGILGQIDQDGTEFPGTLCLSTETPAE